MSNATEVERRSRWLANMLRKLAAWEEALNTDPVERLEKRVSALEGQVHDLEKSIALAPASDR
jgi:polyhydroxyalkanoate synthesis regulator phasin